MREERAAEAAQESPPEELSDGELRRRRSHAPSEEFIEVDPVTGEDKPVGQGRAEGRRRRSADDAGKGRDCGSDRGCGWGAARPVETTPRGAEGACAGCGRCHGCGRVVGPHDKETISTKREPKEDYRYFEETRGTGGSGGRRAGRGGRGVVRKASEDRTSGSSDEREYRSSPDRRRDVDSAYHHHLRDRGRGGGRERDRGTDRGHEIAAMAHRSDSSGGRGDRGAARRRRHPQQRQSGGKEYDHRRHHPMDHFGGNPRSGGQRNRRSPRADAGYSSGDVSSFEEEDVTPRRRQARRETAAAAAVTQTSAREASLAAPRRTAGTVRQRARDDRSSDAAFSTPFSTPRRHPAPAAAPAHQRYSTWRDGRRGGRGRREGSPDGVVSGGDRGLHGYPSFPPAVLSEGRRRRPGDLFAAGGGGGGGGEERQLDDGGGGGRRRAGRLAREVRMRWNRAYVTRRIRCSPYQTSRARNVLTQAMAFSIFSTLHTGRRRHRRLHRVRRRRRRRWRQERQRIREKRAEERGAGLGGGGTC